MHGSGFADLTASKSMAHLPKDVNLLWLKLRPNRPANKAGQTTFIEPQPPLIE